MKYHLDAQIKENDLTAHAAHMEAMIHVYRVSVETLKVTRM
jgi:hypothetical protein